MQPRGPDGAPLFQLCLNSKNAASPATNGIPAGMDDHDIHCKLCVHGGLAFVVAPQIGAAWAEQAASVSIRWAVIKNPVPEAAGFIGKQARGPPLMT